MGKGLFIDLGIGFLRLDELNIGHGKGFFPPEAFKKGAFDDFSLFLNIQPCQYNGHTVPVSAQVVDAHFA